MNPAFNNAIDEYGDNYQDYMTQKFSSVNPDWYTQSLDQLTQYYGFNTVGAESSIYLHATHGQSKKVPFIWYEIISLYSLNNQSNWGTGYVKPVFRLLSSNWHGYGSPPPSSELADYYDPHWSDMITGALDNSDVARDNKNATAELRGFILGFMPDDSDNLHCFGAGPDFTTSPQAGNNDFVCGMVALFVAPQARATSYSCYQCNYGGQFMRTQPFIGRNSFMTN